MRYSIATEQASSLACDCLVVGVFQGGRLTPAAQALDKRSGGRIQRWVGGREFSGKAGECLLLHDLPRITAPRVLLAGLGRGPRPDAGNLRKATEAALRMLGTTACKHAASYLTELEVSEREFDWSCRQTVLIAEALRYRFNAYRQRPTPPWPLRQLSLAGEPDQRRALVEAQAIAEGVAVAKNLGNTPPNVCTPRWLAEQATALLGKAGGIKVKALGPAEMKRLGMGALLAVAQGSRQEPRLIIMEYNGGNDSKEPPVVLVGKGITFDTGGISLKPAGNMDEMKFDMCGAASVIGTLAGVARLKLPLRVVGIVPSAENMPGGQATRPGDIVTSMSGRTVEILNTDAEGRLILCDALTYSERYHPRAVIDIATLTGACVIALGSHASGLFGNDESLVQELLQAGQDVGDRAWQLPLWEDYQEQLHSAFADVGNIGGREAGTITAACFLARFTRKLRWAHLDIAGTAWLGGKQRASTGRPVPLLTQYLIDCCR